MEHQYLQLLTDVLQNGDCRKDRTGVGTRAVFGRQIRCHLQDGFPAITTKKLAFNAVVAELLWFLEGSQDERRLCEITHGTRSTEKKTIWSGNAHADYWKNKAAFEGDVGRIYGVQWRKWKNTKIKSYDDYLNNTQHNSTTYFGAKVITEKFDQIQNIINTLKTNPTDRRMICTAFNVGELNDMALPPCHMFFQFFVHQQKQELSCSVYIRSNDLFLGLPFNIASYALLTHIIAQVTNYLPGELIISIGDAHIYDNHILQVKEQLSRSTFPLPQIYINPGKNNIDLFTMNDFKLINYKSHPSILAEMAI